MNVRLFSTTGQSPEQREAQAEKEKKTKAIKSQQSSGKIRDCACRKPASAFPRTAGPGVTCDVPAVK